MCPWECNYAALGHSMMHAQRVLAPAPAAALVDANLAPPPMLSASVPLTPDEAAPDPDDTPGTTLLQGASSSTSHAMDESSRPEREQPELEDSARAAKRMRMNVISYADMQENMEPDLSQEAFGEEVIDSLESYDFQVDDDDDWDEYGDDVVVSPSDADKAKKLIYPYDRNEPQLSEEQMMEPDSIADGIELHRLQNMGVLLDAGCLEDVSYKQLTTRFVRSWRDKEMVIEGKTTRVWLRRSRFVAREFFNWLADEKQSMFSPASSSILSRILPTVFLQHKADDWVLMSCDVQDAFLTQ